MTKLQYINTQRLALLCSALLWACACSAQTLGLVTFKSETYPFIHPERNEIVNADALNSFFDKLYVLKTQQNDKLNILQIGDSHIQADFISGQARSNFQREFGNGGRGLIVPLRVARTNEPFNYKTSSNTTWRSKRCVFVNDSLPIGVGGVTITTAADTAFINVTTFNYPPINYSSTKVTLFYEKDPTAYDYRILDTAGNTIGMLSTATMSSYADISATRLASPANTFKLMVERTNEVQNNATIYGINLENDSNGIIYHSVGVNVAEAFQYARAVHFAEQTPALSPQLIIISLGTNEAQRRPIDKEQNKLRLDSLVKQLQFYKHATPILLTTPPDSYISRKYYNMGVATMHESIVEYAKDNNLAVWDLFSLAGGYKSCYQWKKYGLLRSDGVHFNRKGYELQGNLMYEALIKAYNEYVSAGFR